MKGKRQRKQRGRSAVSGRAGRRRPDAWHGDDAPTREKVLRGGGNAEALSGEASAKERDAVTRGGRVVEVRAAAIAVEPADGGELVATRLRKSTRVPHAGSSAVVVGDEVRFLPEGPMPWVLTEVLPRRTRLARVRRGREEHVICANVDIGAVIASADRPPFKPSLVDRYLVSFAEGGLTPLLVLNKIDLVTAAEAEAMLAPYRDIGVAALGVSAGDGRGIDRLVAFLGERTAVFSGQSGVGKSSLLNRLGGLELKTADVYGALGKGRHTTTTSTMHRLTTGGAIVDTPGIRSFGLVEPGEAALRAFFPEIYAAADGCRFADCRHVGEAGCALPRAIAEGRVRADRLESLQGITGEERGD